MYQHTKGTKMSLNEKYSHKPSTDTLSVASRTTSDYFPQSYKRPAPYLLWDDNIVPIHLPNTSTFSCCRLFLGLLIAFAVLGMLLAISVTVYLAVITSNLMEDVTNERTFDGRLRITQGDTYVPELEDSFSLEFQLKAKKYETMLNILLTESSLRDGFKETEVTGFKSGSLIVFFRVSLDRRKVASMPRDLASAIYNVIASDAVSVQPKVLKEVQVDLGSISVWDSYPKRKKKKVISNIRSSSESVEVHSTSSATVTLAETSSSSSSSLYHEQATDFSSPLNDTSSEEEKRKRLPITVASTTDSAPANNSSAATEAISSTITSPDVFPSEENLKEEKETEEGRNPTRGSAPLGESQEILRGPWTPIVPNSMYFRPLNSGNISSSAIFFNRQSASSSALLSATLKPVTTTGGLKNKSQAFQRAEALTSGIAQEIPFSLDDFSFHADLSDRGGGGSHRTEQRVSSGWVTNGKSGRHPMEANVAALLVLRPPALSGAPNASANIGGPTLQFTLETPLTYNMNAQRRHGVVGGASGKRGLLPQYASSGLRVTSAPVPLKESALGAASSSVFANLKGFRPSAAPPSLHRGGGGKLGIIAASSRPEKEGKKLDLFDSPNEGSEDDQEKQGNVEGKDSLVPLFTTRGGWVTVPYKRPTTEVVRQNFSDESGPDPLRASYGNSSTSSTVATNFENTTNTPTEPETATSATELVDPIVAAESDLVVAEEPFFLSAGTHARPLTVKLKGCSKSDEFQCRIGGCVSAQSRCNRMKDCPDNSDEDGCTCADYLKAQFLKEKICDGVIDCWDYSDENRCPECSPGMYVCPNSHVCVHQGKVCDSYWDCPGGEDEKHCVQIASNLSSIDDGLYHSSGFLMMRKSGRWGRLCVDNLSRSGRHSATSMGLNELARSVCHSLTFTGFVRIERKKAHILPFSRRNDEIKYEVRYIAAKSNDSSNQAVLEFNQTNCRSRDVVWIQCKNLECGVRPMTPSARIVGGRNALAGSWPWQAAMYKNGEYMCGATLINDRWLLSAAHCFYNEINNYWTARLGMLRRGSQAPYEQIHQISHIIIHASYVKVGFINDVALLRLQTPVKYSDYVRPACLPSQLTESVYSGRMCTVVGWGQLLETGHVFPDTLQEVELPIFSAEECRKKTVFLQTYQITENMFCAGYDRGGRDACLGDSGGPLVCQELNGKWELVGITSNGFGCARAWRPGIYTKVANYIGWMNQVMGGPLRNPVRSSCRGHRCRLGKCLPASTVCNGFVECLDGSDERGCS